jgi:hypothetical protein
VFLRHAHGTSRISSRIKLTVPLETSLRFTPFAWGKPSRIRSRTFSHVALPIPDLDLLGIDFAAAPVLITD